MSAFETTTSEVDPNNAQGTTQTTEDYLEEVVKQKGEHWKDPATLAKGYHHAQQRIKELEEIAEKAKEQDYSKRLLEQLQQQAPTPVQGNVEDKNPDSQKNDNTSLTPEELQALIEQTLTSREVTNSVKQNVSLTDSKLTDLYGTEAKSVVSKKAQEMGMSVERLRDIAGESPTAFFRLIGEEPPTKETNTLPKAQVNTGGGFNDSRGGEKNQAYYSNLRRTNRKLYNHPSTQTQMMKDRMRLGEKFNT